MRKIMIWLFSLTLLFMSVGCSGTNKEESADVDNEDSDRQTELFISAAASLTDAMDEVTEVYEADNNVSLTFNFAGSGKLAQQIQQGAPVDVFISANENWMETLIEEGLIKEDSQVNVTGNKLVLIVAKDSPINYESFADINSDDVGQIAIGNPESVPAGEYTEAILRNMEKWDELESKFVFAQDVRQVLTYVETGNADIGFVYESDAFSSDKVKILAESDPALHDPIIYPGGITTDTTHEKEGEKFIEFLLSAEAQEILGKYGFTK